MTEYEREHFGSKYGSDYSTVATALADSDKFRRLGAMTTVMVALTLKTPSEAEAAKFFETIGPLHHTLAEMFYLGLQVGRRIGEVERLEKGFSSEIKR